MDPEISLLLIEDNPGDERLLREALLKPGVTNYELQSAGSLSDGLDRLETDPFDLILLDLNLPDSSKEQTLSSIPDLRKIAPVVVLTGLSDPDLITEALEKGAQDYLYKDEFNGPLLDHCIQNAVNRERVQQNLKRAQSVAQIGSWHRNIPADILYWSDETARIFGENPDTGTRTHQKFLDYVHPEDRNVVDQKWTSTIENECRIYEIEHRIITDEEVKWVKEKAEIEYDERGNPIEAIGTVQDITKRKQTELKLEKSEQRFREMAENINQVFCLYNADYSEVLYVNSAYEQIWDRSVESLYEDPRSVLESIHPDDRERVRKTNHQALERDFKRSYQTEYRIVQPDGTIRWVRAKLNPIFGKNNQRQRIVVLAEDITREKEYEDDLKQSIHEKDTLLKEVHHRVKNNLQVVISLLGLQMRQATDDKIRSLLENARNRIHSMALIHEMLYNSNKLTSLNTADYLRKLTEQIISSQNSGDVQIETRYELEPYELSLDTLIPCAIVLNELLSNALEHAFVDRARGQLEVTFRKVPDARFELSVSDDGGGVPEDFSIGSPDSLGLRLVNNLVERQLHGTVEILKQEGLNFRIQFPVPNADETVVKPV